MRTVLLDTNILLDIVLERSPFDILAHTIMQYIEQQKITAYISTITLVNIHYVVRKTKGKDVALQFVTEMMDVFEITDANKLVLKKAMQGSFTDFEDAVQNFSAVANGIEIIVTRNKKDFEPSELLIFTPDEFIAYIENK